MVFAARVIEDRKLLGKDTRLSIRDNVVSPEEVRRYWKRKLSQTKDMPFVASTPAGVHYWTPCPSPSLATRSHSSTLHSDASTDSEGDEVTIISVDEHDLWDLSDARAENPKPNLFRIMIPDRLRTQELVLVQAKMYMQSSLEACGDVELYNIRMPARFSPLIDRWLWNVRYGRAPYSARISEIEVYETIPKVLSERHPLLLQDLLAVLACHCAWGDRYGCRDLTQNAQKLLLQLNQYTSAAYSSSSPLPTLFQAISRHLGDIVPWARAILEMVEDLLGSITNCALRSYILSRKDIRIADLYLIERNDQAALHYAKRAEKAAAALDRDFVAGSLRAKEYQVRALIRMEAFADAEAMIHAVLAMCLEEEPAVRDVQSSMIYRLATIRRRQGRTAEAWELIDQLLAERLSENGPDDVMVMATAEYCRVMRQYMARDIPKACRVAVRSH